MSEQIDKPLYGLKSIEEAWRNWSKVTEPHFTTQIFQVYVNKYKETVINWMFDSNDKILTIASESVEESLGFIYATYEIEELKIFRDKMIIIESENAAKRIKKIKEECVFIVSDIEVEKIIDRYSKNKIISIKSNIYNDNEININLEVLTYGQFSESIKNLNLSDSKIRILAQDTGKSFTILRRRLSTNSFKEPKWANNENVTNNLIPYAFLGGVNNTYKGDIEIILNFLNQAYENSFEKEFNNLLEIDDSPVWRIDDLKGVKSRLEVFYSLRNKISNFNIEQFFNLAKEVLDNNKIIKNENIISTRKYSDFLCNNIVDTLAILSLNHNIFGKQVTIDINDKVEEIVRTLMYPFNNINVLDKISYYPLFAEASPRIFLKSMLKDFIKNENLVIDLLTSWYGSYLLNALELLSWDHENLFKVTKILLELSQLQNKYENSLSSKPLDSLLKIYSPFGSNVSSNAKMKINILTKFNKEYPEILWEICLKSLDLYKLILSEAFKPKFNKDLLSTIDNNLDLNEIKINEEILKGFYQLIKELNVNDSEKINRLLIISNRINAYELLKFTLDKIRDFATNASNEEKESIIVTLLNNSNQNKKLYLDFKEQIDGIVEMLQPTNIIIKNAWVFRERYNNRIFYIKEVCNEQDTRDIKNAKISKYQEIILNQIINEKGNKGIIDLIIYSNSPIKIARTLAFISIDKKVRIELFKETYRYKNNEILNSFLREYLYRTKEKIVEEILEFLEDYELKCYILKFVPITAKTFEIINGLEIEKAKDIWENKKQIIVKDNNIDYEALISKLLENNKFTESIYLFDSHEKQISTKLLTQLLNKFSDSDDFLSSTSLSFEIYNIFSEINKRDDKDTEIWAKLELKYFKYLEIEDYKFNNINKYKTQNNQFFIDLLEILKQPSSVNGNNRNDIWHNTYRVLQEKVKFDINNKELYLEKWIQETIEKSKVKKLVEKYGEFIGIALFNSINDLYNLESNRKIFEIIENCDNPMIYKGFMTSIINSQGATFKTDGGSFERSLSEKYLAFSKKIGHDFINLSFLFEDISHFYKRIARIWDIDAEKDKRLLY
ncbi:hypothetical protein [Staphylococcus borealis]|uniref:hypothetical protein n=1 Tax=Staphylococcus borealis TaxID=2742203 RepID=UPI0039EBD912